MSQNYLLDCSDCVGDERPECADCLVRFLVERRPGVPVQVDSDEMRALRLLAGSGMLADVRPLRAAG